MKRVFIFGYYGFKNIGDEATLAAITKMLREYKPSVEIYALSYNVKHTEKTHKIIGVSRNHLGDIFKAIKNADMVISGGGTLLQDSTSSRSLFYYLAMIIVTKALRKPVMFFSNGFGPIKNKFNQWITSLVVNRVDKITLRDHGSKELMSAIGIRVPMEVTADVTFALRGVSKKEAVNFLLEENIPTDKPLIGISVRPWKVDHSFVEKIAQFADYVAGKGLRVVFIPMQPQMDIEISRKIMEQMKNEAYILEQEYSSEEMLGIIGELEILIGMRLHALIFSAINGVPVIGLEYDPKIAAFLEEMGQYNAGDVNHIDKFNLCVEFDRLWENRKEKAIELSHKTAGVRNTIQHNIEIMKRNKKTK